jgi:4-amino-4-deoxy-L-arabinose transferase-like glycosyltransferase
LGNVLMVQALLVIVSAFILYELGRTLGMGNLGAVAGLFLLLSPNTLFWSVIVMTETLFTTGLTLAFLWMIKAIKGRFPIWGVSILMGVITLIRPIGVVLILIWVIWLFVFDSKRLGMKIAFRRAIGLLIVSLIVLLPWCVRNARQHGVFTLSNVNRVTLYSYHLSQTLVEGEGISWDEAKARVTELGGIGSAIPVILREYPGPFIRVQLRGIARTILGTQEDTWLWLIAEDPYIQEGSGFLESLLHFDFKSLNEALNTIHSRDHFSVILFLLWGVGYTAVLFGLSLVGVIKGLGRGDTLLRGMVILGLLTVAYLIVSPGAAGEARFRVPAEPILAFFAGLALMKKAK